MKRLNRATAAYRRLCAMVCTLLLTITYIGQSQAVIVTASCKPGPITAGPYIISAMPTNLTDGFVIAKRVMTTSFTYNKTGTAADQLIVGGWYTQGTMNSTHKTTPVLGASGIGFRMTNMGSIGDASVNTTAFNTLNSRTVQTAGSNLIATETWLQEFVVTNAKTYNGGKITGISGAMLNIIFGNINTWNDKNLLPGGSRCTAFHVLMNQDIIAPEGGGNILPELPPPANPTCDLGGVNIEVGLPEAESSTLLKEGDISGGKSFSIPLGNCGKDAKPYITFTDSNNKSNRTNILSLSPSSTAKGVGIVLEKSDSSLVQLGAQNTTVSSSNVGQFLVGTSISEGGSVPLNLTAKYIRTKGELGTGGVKADAIFTVAYP
ncbi:fimbrial protein [Yersinia artesiana]|uniref:fimbrial protein n=1 Tax=Yersinia artesiana TaxID=2890315 RepID=UPI001582E804|nr:fimbrial protein [Yersinia artesiana]